MNQDSLLRFQIRKSRLKYCNDTPADGLYAAFITNSK
jgi:hypothetical protein